MAYHTYTVWVDDDVVDESEDGQYRVVLRPDEDSVLQGDVYPLMVATDHQNEFQPLVSVYRNVDVPARPAERMLAKAADHFRRLAPSHLDWEDMTERWARLYLGSTALVRHDARSGCVLLADSPEVRWDWGLTTPRAARAVLQSSRDELSAWLEGETYGAVAQKRIGEDVDGDDWQDLQEVYGLIGRQWAEQEAREMLSTFI